MEVHCHVLGGYHDISGFRDFNDVLNAVFDVSDNFRPWSCSEMQNLVCGLALF